MLKSMLYLFWVKCGKTGTYVLELFDHDNSRHICKTYTISSANTWEQKKLIFDNETSNPFGNDNGKSLELQFYLNAGSNFTSGTLATSWASNTNANRAVGQVNVADSTSNKYFLTGVQLEVESCDNPVRAPQYGDELARCQQHFYRHGDLNSTRNYALMGNGMIGHNGSTDTGKIEVVAPVRMRQQPTVSVIGTDSFIIHWVEEIGNK